MLSVSNDFTGVLGAARDGDAHAAQNLWEMVYKEMKNLARRRFGSGRGETLSSTALVHEAYLKMGCQDKLDVQDRNHFMALACRVMRQVLVQNARYHGAQKRMNGQYAETLDEGALDNQSEPVDVLVLNEALEQLEAVDKRMVRVVECRYLGGLSTRETADALELSTRSVERYWTRAKIYLYDALRGTESKHPAMAGAC